MRFSLDEISVDSSSEDDRSDHDNNDIASACSSESSLNEYSFINTGDEDDGVPQLYLPKYESVHGLRVRKNQGAAEEERLDPELMRLMGILQSKLPRAMERSIIPLTNLDSMSDNTGADATAIGVENKFQETRSQSVSKTDISKLLSAMQNCFLSKLNNLEEENKKQVECVTIIKKKDEEERRRKMKEERKRMEEEERKQRLAEEERQRLIDEQRKQEEKELRIKEAEEKKAKIAREAERRAEEERRKLQVQQKLKQEELKSNAVTNFEAIEQLFCKYKEKIATIKRDIVEPIKKADPTLRALLSRHKRKVNPKFGQLTNSNQQLEKIQFDICSLVDETRSNDLAYRWILNFIAKAMVHQAETEARVKPESGLPLGKLALNLLVKYPELEDLLLARFVKKCPFVIGFTANINTELGRQKMGWKRNSDDKWEEETSYDERMGGIMTFYALITTLPLPAQVINSREHPLPISKSWHILARICNTSVDLLTNTHFVVLGAWWDAAASVFLQAYGNQGRKLLQLVSTDLTLSVADRKYVGAARLRILFEEWQTAGIKSFPAMET
ncbi:hypothetical protein HG535_0F05070 [Zygotorulaspora mrakii]|uniref:mRNA export factor GLE1 n=1 Tax=Zygotorulaspora mrakii TaxID=42260 RepID=A0A7H9B5M7_ZYGMR|nr:uncharacterized protein HG535_0F05070 [Zygotorulaspora mrakii]QLG73995.1 hypothetical protein HG535_0F05070 [Zygotorulaspora mrakii]